MAGNWRQVFPPGWFPYGNIKQDFGFLTVRGDVQARAGAESLGFSLPAPASVGVEAYAPRGSKDWLCCWPPWAETSPGMTASAAGRRPGARR
jgi:hypothetical protein